MEQASWTVEDKDLVAQLDSEARRAWYENGHPGWAFYPEEPVRMSKVGTSVLLLLHMLPSQETLLLFVFYWYLINNHGHCMVN